MNIIDINKIDCVKRKDYQLEFTYISHKQNCCYIYKITEFLYDDLSPFVKGFSDGLEDDFSEYLLMEDFLDGLKCQIRYFILLEHSIKIIFKSDDAEKSSPIPFLETQFFSLMIIYNKLHKVPVKLNLNIIAGEHVSDVDRNSATLSQPITSDNFQ